MSRILSLSYGKDSLACLEACKLLGYPIDRVIHAEVWATQNIPADLPPMVEFKKKADAIIKERYGIIVEHIYATKSKESTEKLTYEDIFYRPMRKRKVERERENLRIPDAQRKLVYERPQITGFATKWRQYCTGELKIASITNFRSQFAKGIGVRLSSKEFSNSSLAQGADTNIVRYIGIAADEPERIKRYTRPGIILPLVDIGWDEAYCRQWCEENDLLSPIYTNATRGGCWFCHNQSVEQLRLLRKEYPELWEILLKWDWDSPITFKPDGRTVHDYDLRFYAEDLGLVPADRKFRWKVLDNPDFYKEEK